ncbi:MAG TPA: ABC transporter ATP-binding protein [Verrucomicrobiae bacterium]|nr:ABC transporter ATP-binding protein [Verrucomicrobiae bacterium]
MRDYLKRVFELTRPYRFRFFLGLVCGFVSGALVPTLGLSLNLAVDVVFPPAAEATNELASASAPIQGGTNGTTLAVFTNSTGLSASAPASAAPRKRRGMLAKLPAPLLKRLDNMAAWFRPGGQRSTARMLLVISLIPASMLLRSILGYLNTYLLSWVGIRAANDLRVRLFEHLMNLPLGFFNWTSTGDLMQRFEGAMAVNTTIKDCFGVMIREPIQIVVLVMTLLALQPVLTLITLMMFPICLVPIIVFGRKFRKSDSGVHGKFASLANVMHESFTGIRVIKGYNLETRMLEDFRRATQAVTSFFMRAIRAGELPGPMIEFLGSLGVALVFAYFAFFPKASASAGSGTMLGFFIMVFSLYAPFKNLSRLQHQLAMAKAGVEPAYKLLETKTSLPEPADPKPLQAHGAPIRFEDVTFSYGEKKVLHNVNLTIQPGQLVALVGRTGSGKTSLVNLLLRFYDPQKGAIRIGATDIRSVSSRDLRANIAVVTQETILFNDTIRQNIALGRPGATNAEIEEASRHAYAHGFITEKPNGYDTHVGEKGVNVSGGQRQRIAIARAILRDAPILILDEATSALDSEAEKIVQTALEELMQGRTTICIAHRLSTIRKADVIVVLDNGRIVETGNHEQLLAARGLYSKLYELGLSDAHPNGAPK